MKKLVTILLLLSLTGVIQHAGAQGRHDFSDWNVPPPVPPGGILKGIFQKKANIGPVINDVQPPVLPKIEGFALASVSPILITSHDVVAPGQPDFPEMPFKTPDIPLPAVPEAITAPKQVLQDEPDQAATDLPVPAVPDMPDFPKVPDIIPGSNSDEPIPIPLTPGLLSQPSIVMLADGSFPFTEWSIPPVPLDVNITMVLPGNINDKNSIKPKTIKKVQKKQLRRKGKHKALKKTKTT